jgi:phosphoesterase RecJ-like protein
MVDCKRLLELLSKREDYIILIHRNPDGDAVGSAEALRILLEFLGKRAQVLSFDTPPSYLSFLPAKPFLSKDDPLPAHPTFLSVDVAEEKLLGFSEEAFPEGIYVKIDHHKTGSDFAKHCFVDEQASAAGEVVYLLGKEAGLESPAFLTACYAAIACDTGCFRYSNATAKTFAIAAELLAGGVDTKALNAALFENKNKQMVKANALGILSARFYLENRVALLFFTNEMCKAHGLESEHLAELSSVLREIEGVELSLVLKEKKDAPGTYRISARSKHFFDCTALLSAFNGGGHARAAGGEITASDTEEATKRLLEKIAEQF